MVSLASERFRISVDLGRYFGDARALSYMRVPAARRVRWLAARLARRWRLPGPGQGRLALASRGHLLPPGETLALLRPDDVVEVIPWGDDWFIDGDDINTASEDNMSPVRKQQMEEDTVPERKQQMEEDTVLARKQQMEEDTVLVRKQQMEEDIVPVRMQQMEEDTVLVRKQQMEEDTVLVRKQQMEEDIVPVRMQQMEEDTVPVMKQQKIASEQQNPHENECSGYNNHTESQKEMIDDKTMEEVLSRSPVSVQSDSDVKRLEELKRSALALLEQCAHAHAREHEPTDTPDGAAPRRRRRVRRRVRREPHGLHREHHAEMSGSETTPKEDSCGSRGECEPAVLRNGARARGEGRAARIVRPLHELTHGSPSAHCVPEKCQT